MWVGDVVDDRFVIERPIGSGGMGSVFVALDRRTGDRVAVKVVDLAGSDVDDRFGREARVLAEVAHPSVVRYLASGRSADGAPYLVMEWLEGEDLSCRLARGALPLQDALTVVRRAAEGIAVAHARGIVHRDIKPSNLFLVGCDARRLKVLDFGIARMRSETQTLTRTGGLLGTVGYMAPEQASDPKRADARADVFSLGCVLYECLTGQPPYVGATPVAVLSKLLCDEPPVPSVLCPGLPPGADDLVAAMLARNIEQRPADAAKVAQRISDLQALVAADAANPTVPARFTDPPVTSEQRTTSVLYVRGMDVPEDLVERTVVPFEGTRTRVSEDTWLVILGGRGMASDRARRAAACALALRDSGLVHVVLATGRAETARGSLVGPSIDRAAALLDSVTSAPPGTVFVDDVTASLVENAFDVDRRGVHAVLLSARADTGAARLLMGKPTPFVGREKDLAVLEATLVECIEEGVARAVVVTAPPGMGKSRLRREFIERVERQKGVTVLLGSGEAIGSGSALTLAKQLLRVATGAAVELSAEEQASRIQTHIGSVAGPNRHKHVAEFVAEMLGVRMPFEPSIPLRAARSDPATMAELLPKALDEWLLAECAPGPVLVVVDDLHWADGPSVDLLVRAVRASGRNSFLVLAFARPEVRDAFPGLWALSPMQLPLSGLGPRAAERLARVILGPKATEKDVARVVALADGNAFYVEELTRAIAEGRGVALPESVLAMAEARLDALEPEARVVLRAVSVIGERFSSEAAGVITGEATSTKDWLEALADREILERGQKDPGRGIEYAFRHALLREAAYAQLVDSERRGLHARVADWLEQQSVRDAIGLAQHWEQADELARAVPWLTAAAEQAYHVGDTEAAGSIAQRALALGATRNDRGRLRTFRAACLITSAPDEAFGLALGASEELTEGSAEWFLAVAMGFWAGAGSSRSEEGAVLLMRLMSLIDTPFPTTPNSGYALYACATMLQLLGQLEPAERVSRRLDERARESGNSDLLFEFYRRFAETFVCLYCRDSYTGALSAGRAAAALADEIGTAVTIGFGGQALGCALLNTGALSDAEQTVRQALAKTGAFRPGLPFLCIHLAMVLEFQGRYDEALDVVRAAMTLPGLTGLVARAITARVLVRSGALDDAERLALGLEPTIASFPGIYAFQRIVLASVALARADAARALELSDHGIELAASGWREPGTLTRLGLLRARSLHALGRFDDARDAIRHLRERVRSARDSIEEPEIRNRYVDAFSEVRETLALAQEWLQE